MLSLSETFADNIGIITSCPSVRLYVCNTVHCGSQGRCTGLKVVQACS